MILVAAAALVVAVAVVAVVDVAVESDEGLNAHVVDDWSDDLKGGDDDGGGDEDDGVMVVAVATEPLAYLNSFHYT